MLLGAGVVTLVAALTTGTAEAGADAGRFRSALNAEVTAAPNANLTVAVGGRETYQQVSALSGAPAFTFDQDRLTSITVTAAAGEPHLGLWVGVRHARARAKEKLRGSLVFDRAGGENVSGSVSGRWNPGTRTFEGTWHGKQVTRPNGKKKTLVLSGTLRLELPVGAPPVITAS